MRIESEIAHPIAGGDAPFINVSTLSCWLRTKKATLYNANIDWNERANSQRTATPVLYTWDHHQPHSGQSSSDNREHLCIALEVSIEDES